MTRSGLGIVPGPEAFPIETIGIILYQRARGLHR
jgi:hypothetical protein